LASLERDEVPVLREELMIEHPPFFKKKKKQNKKMVFEIVMTVIF
jgi:hypothetical protein